MPEARLQKQTRAQPQAESEAVSLALVGLLAWLVPGLGHWVLSQRRRALVFFVSTCVTFWAGVALGGVRSTVHPTNNGFWFAAQLCMGAQTLAAWSAGSVVAARHPDDVQFLAFAPSDTIAVVYSGVAGLLNLLIVVDAICRADARAAPPSGRAPPPRGTT